MSAPAERYVFRARRERVVDGDTLDITLDMGFHLTATLRLRLAGVNAPELHGESRVAGAAARDFVAAWTPLTPFDGAWPLVVQTYKSDAFGRFVARVWRSSDGGCLNDALLASGNAVAFMPGEVAP